ncbi:NAD(P)H-binding protein [Saccharothrix australiensis]|uniref:NAD(P)H-binding protein n=1 Tax=Saccharothrix australiensis TaxID=2072 RepID=UPI001FE7287E|nr:NAD(P)H-binding protein [Saccharothrix australiensis]
MTTAQDAPILVIGGTGKTGRRVVDHLRARGASVRVAARHGDVTFSWTDRDTWAPALAGVRAVHIVAIDGVSRTDEFVAAAVEAGVRRFTLLSARGVDVPDYYGEGNAGAATHLLGERALHESGVDWTVLRPGWFMQNFDEGIFRDDVRRGELRLAAAEGAAAFVDAEDIGEVAAVALTEDGHAGRTYDLTGPRALTFHEALAEIADASGVTARYRPIPEAEFIAELVEAGWSPSDAALWSAALDPIRRGVEGALADGVQQVLGREPRDFRAFAAAARDAWRD